MTSITRTSLCRVKVCPHPTDPWYHVYRALSAAEPPKVCPKHGTYEGDYCAFFETDEVNYEGIGVCGFGAEPPKEQAPTSEVAWEQWRKDKTFLEPGLVRQAFTDGYQASAEPQPQEKA